MSRMDNQITNDMIRLVNENADMYRIAEYIISKYDGIDINDAREFAKYLTRTLEFTKSEIITGKADKTIFNWVKGKTLVKNSVLQKGEKRTETQLKTKKENIQPTNFKKRIVLFLATTAVIVYILVNIVTGVVTYVTDVSENYKLETSVSQSIGMLASQVGNDAYEYKMNIVAQNTYHVPGQFDASGNPVIAYYNDKIAEDIIKVCSYDSSLFEICMQNTYFNMEQNRLRNMDKVLEWLQINTKDEESLSYIYDQIRDCDVFLEYLLGQGFISPNDEDYHLILEDIEQYKALCGDVRSPFSALPKESQKRLQKLIDEYKKNTEITYPEFVGKLEQLVEDGRKGGGR